MYCIWHLYSINSMGYVQICWGYTKQVVHTNMYIHFPQYDMFSYKTPKTTTWIHIVHTEMVWEDMKEGLYTKCYLKLAQIISEFEGQRLQTRPFPNNTRAIWVLGKHTYIQTCYFKGGHTYPVWSHFCQQRSISKKTWWNILFKLPRISSFVSKKNHVFFVHGRKLLPVSTVIVAHWFIKKRQKKHEKKFNLSRDDFFSTMPVATMHQRSSFETNDGFNPIASMGRLYIYLHWSHKNQPSM